MAVHPGRRTKTSAEPPVESLPFCAILLQRDAESKLPAKDNMEVLTNEAGERFEIVLEGQCSVLDYQMDGQIIVFTHTGVPPSLEGRGIGSALAKAGLEFARKHDFKVRPACRFISVYIRRHPEYQDLLEAD